MSKTTERIYRLETALDRLERLVAELEARKGRA